MLALAEGMSIQTLSAQGLPINFLIRRRTEQKI